jgi:hypothetical protein
LFTSSEELFERPEKLLIFFLVMKQHGFVHPAGPFSNRLKIAGVGRFVEQTRL